MIDPYTVWTQRSASLCYFSGLPYGQNSRTQVIIVCQLQLRFSISHMQWTEQLSSGNDLSVLGVALFQVPVTGHRIASSTRREIWRWSNKLKLQVSKKSRILVRPQWCYSTQMTIPQAASVGNGNNTCFSLFLSIYTLEWFYSATCLWKSSLHLLMRQTIPHSFQ
jgi:hypothetical protein